MESQIFMENFIRRSEAEETTKNSRSLLQKNQKLSETLAVNSST